MNKSLNYIKEKPREFKKYTFYFNFGYGKINFEPNFEEIKKTVINIYNEKELEYYNEIHLYFLFGIDNIIESKLEELKNLIYSIRNKFEILSKTNQKIIIDIETNLLYGLSYNIIEFLSYTVNGNIITTYDFNKCFEAGNANSIDTKFEYWSKNIQRINDDRKISEVGNVIINIYLFIENLEIKSGLNIGLDNKYRNKAISIAKIISSQFNLDFRFVFDFNCRERIAEYSAFIYTFINTIKELYKDERYTDNKYIKIMKNNDKTNYLLIPNINKYYCRYNNNDVSCIERSGKQKICFKNVEFCKNYFTNCNNLNRDDNYT